MSLVVRWPVRLLLLKRVLIVLAALCAFYAAIAGADSYPYLPACVLVVFSALWIVVLWKVFFPALEASKFLDALAMPLYADGAGTLVWWVYHIASNKNHAWSKELQAELAFRSEGIPMNPSSEDFEYPKCVLKNVDLCASEADDDAAAALDVDFGPCLQAFVLWVTPVLLGLVLCAAGYASQLVSTLLMHQEPEDAAVAASAGSAGAAAGAAAGGSAIRFSGLTVTAFDSPSSSS